MGSCRTARLALSLVGVLCAAAVGWPAQADALSQGLVISQVYAHGGANPSATFSNDYVEIFNRGTTSIALSGKSLQYLASGGSTWTKRDLPAVTVPAGRYFLVQLEAGTNTTNALPAPDYTPAPFPMSTTGGTAALVDGTTTLTCGIAGNRCASSQVIDMVGYGSAPDWEGAGPPPNPTAQNSATRLANGCRETDQNSADFAVVAAAPRNSSAPAQSCDSDGDGVLDGNDNCPSTGNADQTNTDAAGDGGDACDGDDDNDAVVDASDNCPLASNASQTDTDGAGDGGDACDGDDDNDGIPDAEDPDPLRPPSIGGASSTGGVSGTDSGSGSAPLDAVSPALTGLSITNKRFKVGTAATPIAARTKTGTAFRYTLSETSTVTTAIQKAAAGRRSGRSCVKPTRSNRAARKCTRYVAVKNGTLTRNSAAGPNTVPFSGRIGTKALKPGGYRAVFGARDGAGNTATTTPNVRFKIVKR